MEIIEDYIVTLIDDYGQIQYEVKRVNLTRFIAGIKWDTVRELKVESRADAWIPSNTTPESTESWYAD